MFGVSAALTTPFKEDGSVDHLRLNNHINNVLSQGCSSVTFFGTTGEGPSIASDVRLEAIRAAVETGIDPADIVLSLHGAAADDVVWQAKSALHAGVKQFLLPPPCYFNGPTDQGLYNWFASVLSQFTGTGAQFILYHIPQVIGVALPVRLVGELKAAFPDTVFGVKDSSGSFENTKELLQLPGLEILVGDERLLAASVKIGATGAISGVANIFPGHMSQIVTSGINNPQIDHLVDIVLNCPVTPAIKALVAHKYGDNEWRTPKPPLVAVSDSDFAALAAAHDLVDPMT